MRGLGLAMVGLLGVACATPGDPSPPSLVEETEVESGTQRDLAQVSHRRELRGVWISTVSNLDWPSRPGLDVSAQKEELTGLLDTLQSLHFNTVFFQVRPGGDALYRSDLEPWSRVLSGQQGQDPGWDPLDFLIEEAHARNLEVHAWFNPYRAAADGANLAQGHMGRVWPEHLHRVGAQRWMDPGAKEVQDRAVEVILDVAQRYPIDGVHLDDYFYPYPDGTSFPDDRTWAAYRLDGGTLERDDWRRENVHRVVQRIGEGLDEIRPEARFGISPFGIYRPGIPDGVRGLDAYAEIYADPVRWMEKGWVDYLAPQLYWSTQAAGQPFEGLLRWWGGLAEEGREVYAGHALHRWSEWSVQELEEQIRLTREIPGSSGQIWFRARFVLDHPELQALLASAYPRPALAPPVPGAEGRDVPEPRVQRDGQALTLAHAEPSSLRSWAVYRWEGEWILDEVRPAQAQDLRLGPGRWAVSAVDRWGAESPGVVVEIPHPAG